MGNKIYQFEILLAYRTNFNNHWSRNNNNFTTEVLELEYQTAIEKMKS
jgi:hypothetical protein